MDESTGFLRSAVPMVQRAVLLANRGPMRPLVAMAYRAAARMFAEYVVRGEPGASAYVRGSLASGDMLPGLSDIDVEVVLPSSADAAEARERVRRRFARASSILPVVGDLVDDWPSVFVEDELAAVSSHNVFTAGLDGRPPRTAYRGSHVDPDSTRLLERPEIYGQRRAWRRLAGPDRALAERGQDADARRLTAWLELQNWWRWAFDACAYPERVYNAHLCVKLIAEPVRALVWMTEGQAIPSRLEALRVGADRLPEHADAFERARRLHGELDRMPTAPLDEILPAFLALSHVLARDIETAAGAAGSRSVTLGGGASDPLALPDGGLPARPARVVGAVSALMPLTDWCAVVAAHRPPDETFALVDGDGADPGTLAALATWTDRGPYPTLRAGDLLLRPAPMGGRQRLRAVQCAATDPVSFALSAGSPSASFPELPGLSIADTAARALAEHSAWLAGRTGESAGRSLPALGTLISSARAGLLWETVREGEPELALMADAVLDALGERSGSSRTAIDETRRLYPELAVSWQLAPAALARDLRSAVAALPAYATRAEAFTLAAAA